MTDRDRLPDREFVGYGRSGIRIRWPDDARIAVNLCINYEEGSERSFWAGDGQNEPPNELGYATPPIRDLANESIFEYGSRAGIWRLQRMFERFGIPVTFFGCARAFELNHEVGAYIAEAGHDVCCHGLRWEDVSRLDYETERAHLLEAIESITTTCGARPTGWYAKAPPSLHTRELLVEEGGFLYDSDSFADDLPYFVEVKARRHLVIPYTFVTNDSRYLPGQAFATPTDFLDNCRRAFDVLWAEGQTHPKLLTVGLHPRWIGQPARASALQEFLEHALGHEHVWFARREDVARWWIAQHGTD